MPTLIQLTNRSTLPCGRMTRPMMTMPVIRMAATMVPMCAGDAAAINGPGT